MNTTVPLTGLASGALSPPESTRKLLVSIAVVLTTGTIVSYFRTWYRLRHVPGPFLNSLTVFAQITKSWGGQYHLYLEELHQKYGPLVRVGPSEVMFSDPDTFKRVNGARSQYTRGPFFEVLRAQPGKDHISSTRSEQRHKELRGKMGPGYAGQQNHGFEKSLDNVISLFIELLERKYISTDKEYRPVDFSNIASYFTMDVISEIAYGEPFGHLKQDKDVLGYIEQQKASLPVLIILGSMPGLMKLFDHWPFTLLLPSEADKFGLGYMVGFATKFVDHRFELLEQGHPPGTDIIQSFINHGLGRDQLIQEITLQVLAGSDTSATTIRMTILYLLANPPALRRLLDEIDTALSPSSTKLSDPTKSGKIITNAEASSLPYLQAVIREALRIHPPATGLVGKLVPSPGGDTVHGYKLPEGTALGQNIWGICRRKDMFGEDAEAFRPERWLEVGLGSTGEVSEADNARLREMITAQEMVFGYGKYGCLGRGLVGMELGKVYFELFRRYDFSVINPVKPMSLLNAAMWVTNDFWLRITRREHS
ncbi:Pisatin demethylase 13 [Naviculisporaceae sp. PSN 640]